MNRSSNIHVLNQAENDQFEHHKNYADLHLLVEGHEYSSYGSRIKDEAVAFDEASDIGFVHCHEKYPLLLGYHNFAIFNVADSYLTVGVIVLLIAMLKEEVNGNKN